MSLNQLVKRQSRARVNQSAEQLAAVEEPPREGWLRTLRQALGMSGLQLAQRLGVTRARVSKLEQDEARGSVTLKSLEAAAKAMGCRFVYAIVPEQDVEDVLKEQAHKVARQRIEAAATHMALEEQLVDNDKLELEVERLANELLVGKLRDLWDE